MGQELGRINTLRPRQKGGHIADDSLKCIFSNENVWLSIKISKVSKGPIDNIPELVYTMAWRRPGDKPLSEPMLVILPTHICFSRPQWVNQQILKPPIDNKGANAEELFVSGLDARSPISNIAAEASKCQMMVNSVLWCRVLGTPQYH